MRGFTAARENPVLSILTLGRSRIKCGSSWRIICCHNWPSIFPAGQFIATFVRRPGNRDAPAIGSAVVFGLGGIIVPALNVSSTVTELQTVGLVVDVTDYPAGAISNRCCHSMPFVAANLKPLAVTQVVTHPEPPAPCARTEQPEFSKKIQAEEDGISDRPSPPAFIPLSTR